MQIRLMHLAAAAVAGTSAFVTGSHVAHGAAFSLALPDCAGSGVGAVRAPATAAAFNDPSACTWLVEVVAETIEHAAVHALTLDETDPTVLVDLATHTPEVLQMDPTILVDVVEELVC